MCFSLGEPMEPTTPKSQRLCTIYSVMTWVHVVIALLRLALFFDIWNCLYECFIAFILYIGYTRLDPC